MAKKKSKAKEPPVESTETPPAPPRTRDRHLKRKQIPLPVDLHRQLKRLAARNSRPLNWEVRLRLQQILEAEGLWPPQPEGP